MLGAELPPLQRRGVVRAIERVHLGAKVAQPPPAVARRALLDEIRHHVVELAVVVVQALEEHQRAEQRARLAVLDAGRQQEQDRVEVVLLRRRCGSRAGTPRAPARARRAPRTRRWRGRNPASAASACSDRSSRSPARRCRSRATRRRARSPSSRDWPRDRRSARPPSASVRGAPRPALAPHHRVGHERIEEPLLRADRPRGRRTPRRPPRIFFRSSMPRRIVSSHSTSPWRPFIICAPTSSEANSG